MEEAPALYEGLLPFFRMAMTAFRQHARVQKDKSPFSGMGTASSGTMPDNYPGKYEMDATVVTIGMSIEL